MLEVPQEYRKELPTDYLMVREFSHEKEFAPEGKNLLQTMIYCKEKEARSFIELSKDKLAYKERKQRISQIISTIITDKFPTLRDKVNCIDTWTPATYRRYVGSQIGSWMAFALPPKMMPKKLSNRVKGLKNVILATQWLQMPGGLPIAASSGKRAIQTICKLEQKTIETSAY